MIVTWEPAAGAPPQSSLARDMALGGLFIETMEPIAKGTLLTVEMSAGTKKVSLDARVFYVREQAKGPHEPAGMAVRFLDLPVGTLADLTAIVEHHRPPQRTMLGVGDEGEALWQSAGGKDEIATKEEVALPSYITELEIPARESIEAQARIDAKRAPSIPAPEPIAPSLPPSGAPPSLASATSTAPPAKLDDKKDEPKRPLAQIVVLVALILLALVAAMLARSAISGM